MKDSIEQKLIKQANDDVIFDYATDLIRNGDGKSQKQLRKVETISPQQRRTDKLASRYKHRVVNKFLKSLSRHPVPLLDDYKPINKPKF